MAFTFNWSPLATDASFYERAKELLTNALNRAEPRPAIIVDDFRVSEFSLGEIPPELEIVEIGDLAEDKFRGTFKMRYQGDAVLSLKTKVQANPLNTYLLTRASFASPHPLAAATGLTIPLQITLSDFRLSGFIILVFSRQKGLTIVFKDDPLESLKVSSTFDSIPFVANYLQKEIETQLRNLLMDDLPAIIHRLSLSFWRTENSSSPAAERELQVPDEESQDVADDPLASPPQDPVDSSGNALSPSEVTSLSLDSSVETQSLFSHKNLLKLATLTDSHRTLSLFTPSIRDAVFRAWTGPLERGEMPGFQSRATSPRPLSRVLSQTGLPSIASTYESSVGSRPGFHLPAATSHSVALGRHGKTKKRKHRVVNLRRKKTEDGQSDIMTDDGSTATDSASVAASTSDAPPSIASAPPATLSPEHRFKTSLRRKAGSVDYAHDRGDRSPALAGPSYTRSPLPHDPFLASSSSREDEWTTEGGVSTIRAKPHQRAPIVSDVDVDATPRASVYLSEKAAQSPLARQSTDSKSATSETPLPGFLQFISDSSNSGSIAERAWVTKMVAEMNRKYVDEKAKGSFGPYLHGEEGAEQGAEHPPPAYAR
ncbi:hypothetical protein DV738_g1430, partial [Chaetothyriales sp. CBS 135597]